MPAFHRIFGFKERRLKISSMILDGCQNIRYRLADSLSASYILPGHTKLQMSRQILTSLLVAGYMAGQFVAAPHAHAVADIQESSQAAPHVHLNGHADTSRCHHHSHAPCSNQSAESEHVQIAGDLEHDSDAVYLPNGINTAVLAKSTSAPTSFDACSASACTLITASLWDSSNCVGTTRFGGGSSSECDLFLAVRALRI